MKNGRYTGIMGDQKWYKNGKLHRDDGPAIILANGTEKWYQNGKQHRDGGPAEIWANGCTTQRWFQNGQLHRDDGPAVINKYGEKFWYLDGKQSTEYELNEIRKIKVVKDMKNGKHTEDGTQRWFQNGKLHRTDGPALIRTDGSEFWYQNGERHRTGGPALIWADGTQHWYQHDKHTNEEEFNKQSTKGKVMFKSTVLEKASSIKEAIKPYEKYIVIAALLVALDHFILKGALKSKIQELGIALGNRFTAILDVAIEKIGVGDDKK